MSLVCVLRSWTDFRESENSLPLLESIKNYLQSGNSGEDVSSVIHSKALNSIICAAFSENYPTQVQKSILDLIQFLGSDVLMRCRLITSFSILKSLIFGLVSTKPDYLDQIKLLKTVQLYTFELHHLGIEIEPELFTCLLKFVVRIIRQSKSDELLEPALGILANLSHFTSLVQQSLKKVEDFEILRKCLLRIMSSDNVSQTSLVFSMSIRFYLWKAADKFFEGMHIHKTIQILFNLLLNGEIGLSGLCAGELLSDLCSEPEVTGHLASFPALDDCLAEAVVQLRAKNANLVLKLLHLFRCLLTNGTDHNIEQRTHCVLLQNRKLTPQQRGSVGLNGEHSFEPLGILFNLVSGPDDMLAAASLDLLICLIRTTMGCEESDKENLPTVFPIPYEYFFESIITGIRKFTSMCPTNFRLLCETANEQQPFICSRLLRVSLFFRLSDLIIQQLQADNKPEIMLSAVGQALVDHLSVLAELAFQIVLGQFNGNPLFDTLGVHKPTDDMDMDWDATSNNKVDVDTCLVSADVAIEGMGLMYVCTELLSSLVPSASQDDEVSLTQPTVDCVGVDPKSTPSVARQCGQSLQTLLERPETPGLLAVGLLMSSRCATIPSAISSLGLGLAARIAVTRLLSVALQLDGFDNDQFTSHVNRLQSADGNQLCFIEPLATNPRLSHSFLSQWVRSPAAVVIGRGTPSRLATVGVNSSADRLMGSAKHGQNSSEQSELLEQKVDKFLTEWETQDNSERLTYASEALSLFEYKIRMLQSREGTLESSASANAEALTQANRLCDHYRERAVVAEAEAGQLRALQLNAMARLEADKRNLTYFTDQLKQRNTEIAELKTQLSKKQEECQDLKQKNESLQSKLTVAREQNRAMDATIDDYRTQLDQAKEQIQAQTTQINKFTQITRLINDLTGNPSADLATSHHNLTMVSGDGAGHAGMDSITNSTGAQEGTNARTSSVIVSNRKLTTRSTRR
ncbi:hypothetical protein EG68_06707 [Paragonimus skrjabini miyazakii]|uniref:CIP2A N-terminal domain-containing protein n=1 Tax=Paragonimus skrjabini miyazakii TaxID=59628 RepID=A0A8S9YNG3_9TREM|nr:hypothetical protein EG68_06707 [Paragonimus skrjabini miyazakii]